MNLKHATRDDQRRRSDLRLAPEQLVRLADALPDEEARLIRARYGEGLTYRDLARRYRSEPRRIRRRIDRIADRMQSAEFRFTLLHENELTPKLRKTAKLLFLQGCSLRHTAQATHSTLHRIRTDRATLQTLARAAG
ncbi:sigma factor-like helix-turn-helix DNA-binding protein [Phycisphaeraceae bacterium D3-23]